MTEAITRGPLAGLRVLDLSSVVMGPYATQMLGDYGAEIIAVEPVTGARNRRMGGGRHPELSGIALNLLRNKRAVSLDVKDPAGRNAVLEIARTCDVVVTNLRPRPLMKLGLDYASIKVKRPDIVYCQAVGFRSDQDRRNDPAYDDIIQSESGLADAAFQVSGVPQIAPTIMADKVCGFAIVNAVMAALLHRHRTGEGQRVEVPMIDVMRSFVLVEHGAAAISDDDAPAGYRRVLNSERGPQKTRDGWINILPYSAREFDTLFELNGRHDLVGDPRTRDGQISINAKEIYAELRPIIARRTTAEWMDFCAEHGIPVGAIAKLDDLVQALPLASHPLVGPYRIIPSPVWFTAFPTQPPEHAQQCGEDTRAVLTEVGISAEVIDDLFSRGIAVEPSK